MHFFYLQKAIEIVIEIVSLKETIIQRVTFSRFRIIQNIKSSSMLKTDFSNLLFKLIPLDKKDFLCVRVKETLIS